MSFVGDGSLYMGCGLIPSSSSSAEFSFVFYRYDVINDSWEALPPLPEKWFGIAAGFIIDGIVYAGNPFYLYSYYKHFGTWNEIEEDWSSLDNTLYGVSESDWFHSSGIVYDGEYYSLLPYDRVNFFKFTPSNSTWTKLADHPNLGNKQVIAFEDKIYLFSQDGVYTYNPSTNTWTNENAHLPENTREFRTAFVHNERFYTHIRTCAVQSDGSCSLTKLNLWEYNNQSKTFILNYDLTSLGMHWIHNINDEIYLDHFEYDDEDDEKVSTYIYNCKM